MQQSRRHILGAGRLFAGGSKIEKNERLYGLMGMLDVDKKTLVQPK